ncbi:MAG: isoleucine--tRNA ligase [Chthoniobacterales bacterium]
MSRYRDTVRLPKTNFPMKAGLATREPEQLTRWMAEDLYGQIQRARAGQPRYVLHDGPPFANGHVHMGTALNKILKDLVVKSKTMAGFNAPFVPGWDCHGLPIEYRVVKSSRGLTPLQVREQSETYARKFIDIQRDEFRRLGVFGDWENPYLTLDPAYEAMIIRSFGRIVEKNLVYRSKKPVFWSIGAQTALAEAEVEYHDKISPAAYVAFPFQENSSHASLRNVSAVIWTTTPWTLPANLAIAVQPEATYVILHAKKSSEEKKSLEPVFKVAEADEGQGADGAQKLSGLNVRDASSTGAASVDYENRFLVAEALVEKLCEACALEKISLGEKFLGRDLEGMLAQHPFLPRTSTFYAADFVTLEAGTGLVHIAPGHGEDDYTLGLKKGLEILSPVDDLGRLTEECGVPEIVGLNVFDANPKIIALLAEKGLLLASHDHHHTYPHCWRSKTPILFRAVEQFFISITKLRAGALRAIDETIWLPAAGINRIRGTVESRPDWCISRQRSWGVPLPAFYDHQGQPILDPKIINKVADVIAEKGANAWFSLDDATWCELVGAPKGSTKRNDTLEVWIESGVSHEAVLRTRPELHFPADLYLEATDQHRGWFQSSLLTSVALNDVAPYKAVLTHGFVVDVDTRQKISKSNQGEGGYKKPTEADHFIKTYGSDIIRLWASSVQFTDEVPFSEEIFARLTDSYRRIRNTLRILLGNIQDYKKPSDNESLSKVSDDDLFLLQSSTSTATKQHGVDLWILGRLQEVITISRKAYEELAFQRVYHTINHFCTVDLSSLYVDITKDRLYCDGENSERRRFTQATMARIFETLVRLLAPILVFTTEEAWSHYKPGSSIHLELFPEPVAVDEKLMVHYEKIFALRSQVSQALEKAQREGVIANPLEARVSVITSDEGLLEAAASPVALAELEEIFILSHLEIIPGAENILITKNDHEKCERCWRHREDVGKNEEHPTLCGRCLAAIS